MKKSALKISAVLIAALAVQLFWGWGEVFGALKSCAEKDSAPAVFLAVMGVGCAAALPVSWCYVFAGAAFGILKGWLLCLAGICLSAGLGFWASRALFGKSDGDFLKKRFPGLAKRFPNGLIHANFFARAVPGIPYFLQNIILERLGTGFAPYIFTAAAVQGIIAFGVIFFVSAVAESNAANIAVGALLVGLLALCHAFLARNFSAEKKEAKPSKAKTLALTFLGYAGYAIVVFSVLFRGIFAAALNFRSKRRMRLAFSAILRDSLRFMFFKYLPAVGVLESRVVGDIQNLPPQAVYVSNHRSLLDPLLMLSLIKNCSMCVKDSHSGGIMIFLFKKTLNFIIIKKGDLASLEDNLKSAEGIARAGGSIAVCPEGTRSARLRDFQKFAFKISKDFGLPIVPIAISSKNPILSKDKSTYFFPSKNEFTVRLLPPLYPEDFKSAELLMSASHRKISSALKELDKKYQNTP